MTQIQSDIPISLKRKILCFAKRLPKDKRAIFIRNCTVEITRFAARFTKEHKYTAVYALIGLVVGRVLDQALTFTIPVVGQVSLSLGLLGTLGPIILGGVGFMKDWEVSELQMSIARQVQMALRETT